MIYKRITSILIIAIIAFSFSSCKSEEQSGNTGSITDNGDYITVDISPADPDDVASAAADFKPNKNYNYEKSDTTIAGDEVKADGYILSAKNDKDKEIATVYFEQSDLNSLEIDVMTKDASDSDLDAATKMVRQLILAAFENFPIDELDGQLPLSTAKIKALISNNTQEDNIIYGSNNEISVGYEFEPKSGILFFRIEI